MHFFEQDLKDNKSLQSLTSSQIVTLQAKEVLAQHGRHPVLELSPQVATPYPSAVSTIWIIFVVALY